MNTTTARKLFENNIFCKCENAQEVQGPLVSFCRGGYASGQGMCKNTGQGTRATPTNYHELSRKKPKREEIPGINKKALLLSRMTRRGAAVVSAAAPGTCWPSVRYSLPETTRRPCRAAQTKIRAQGKSEKKRIEQRTNKGNAGGIPPGDPGAWQPAAVL